MLTKNNAIIKKCKPVLEDLFQHNIDLYIDLFFYERMVDLEHTKARVLEKAGILKRSENKSGLLK